tara:strand:+ start:1688 stop:2008 length:321 start_codon:yes stop_codon:yes gene_type:complete
MFKIIDNCISKKNQNIIKKTMFGLQKNFAWYFAEDVTNLRGKQKRPAFFHDFVLKKYNINSNFYSMIKPIVKDKNVIQARAILQLPLNKKLINKEHDTPHVALHVS